MALRPGSSALTPPQPCRTRGSTGVPVTVGNRLPGGVRSSRRVPFAAIDHTAPKRGLADRAREIAERAHRPETDGGVRDGVMADLLESEIEQAVETDPRYGEAQDMRRIKKVAGRRGTTRPSDQNAGELIDAADRCRGIVDRGRERPQRDINDLDDAELDVLLHRPRRADVNRRQQLEHLPFGDAVAARHMQ